MSREHRVRGHRWCPGRAVSRTPGAWLSLASKRCPGRPVPRGRAVSGKVPRGPVFFTWSHTPINPFDNRASVVNSRDDSHTTTLREWQIYTRNRFTEVSVTPSQRLLSQSQCLLPEISRTRSASFTNHLLRRLRFVGPCAGAARFDFGFPFDRRRVGACN